MKLLPSKLTSRLTAPTIAGSVAVGMLLLTPTVASAWTFEPSTLNKVNGTLYFTAYSPDTGWELWKTDGTKAGTVLVKDINPGRGSSFPYVFANVNGTLYFAANNFFLGRKLWKSNGTTGGTALVKDIGFRKISSDPYGLTNLNGTLYFFAALGTFYQYKLHKSDGTPAGTVLVKDVNVGISGDVGSPPSDLIKVNGTLYFSADNGPNGTELWKSNGTEAGTVMVKNIAADVEFVSAIGSYPQWLTNANGTLFFTANRPESFFDTPTGRELWKSNGTEAGTVLVKDIFPGSASSNPVNLISIGSTVYFGIYRESSAAYELWKSNGTAAGTVKVYP